MLIMANITNCPYCGRANVKGKNMRLSSDLGSMATGGALLGSFAGPPGAAIGGIGGAIAGKFVNMCFKNEYKYTCPRCGKTWTEKE